MGVGGMGRRLSGYREGALWLLRERGWGVGHFVTGLPALVGLLMLLGLLLPQGEPNVLEGWVAGYRLRVGRTCFTVKGDSICVAARVPVRDGQLVRVSRVRLEPVRIEVARTTAMAEAEVEERQREARRRAYPFQRAVLLGMLPVAAGVFGWISLYWRRSLALWVSPPHSVASQVAFRGFVALNGIGAFVRFGEELQLQPLATDETLPAVIALTVIGAVTFLGFRHFVREVEGRRRAGTIP